MDPCEKEPTDSLESMLLQAREDITVSAQVPIQSIYTDSDWLGGVYSFLRASQC